MRKKAEFPMRYIYKENGGKHTALNVGVKQITSELTFIVDSDDTLVPDAIETILRYHKKYGEKKDLCGYSFLRRLPDGKINGKPFEPDEKVGTYIQCRINADDTQADKSEVFYTRCLKEFPFPEYRNEKFLGEDLVWIRMAMKYQMVHINRAIYVGNYLEDGLTKNRRKNNIRSPYGCMERAKEFMRPELKLKYRLKGAVQYLVYGKFAGEKQLIAKAPYKGLAVCVALPSMLVYHRWSKSI
jgi:glycosyltransferase involved in cell wall biosynthesis